MNAAERRQRMREMGADLLARLDEAGETGQYVLVKYDPQTDEYRARGPWPGDVAVRILQETADEFERIGLGDVDLHLARWEDGE